MSRRRTEQTSPSRARFGASVALAVACGALVALQSRINGQLGASLNDGFIAAVISFGSGLIIVIIALSVSRHGRSGVAKVTWAVRRREIPWWYICGGFGGGLFVLSQGLTVGLIGVALFTVATVAGQTIGGLIIDTRGIGRVAPKRMTPARLLGSVIALIAVGIAVGPQIQGIIAAWVIIMPLAVGLLLGWQQAVNGQVKTLANSALTATFFNFLAGTVLLLVFAIVNTLIAGWPHGFPSNPVLYLGGLTGVLFIAGFAAVIPIIGVLVQSLAAVAGQLVMSLVLTIVTPTNAAALAWTTVLGTALTLVGVVIVSLPTRATGRAEV